MTSCTLDETRGCFVVRFYTFLSENVECLKSTKMAAIDKRKLEEDVSDVFN